MDQTFGKKYKLCKQKQIDQLFKVGQVEKQFPLLAHFIEVDEILEAPFQIVVSAPKRNFRKAHDRNRIKRLMKETIRFNKFILENHVLKSQKNLILFLVYTSKEEVPFQFLLKKNAKLFENIVNKLTKNDQE